MNRTTIDYANYTWNPCTGCLGPHNDGQHCSYCYAKRIATRFAGTPAFPNGFAPTFHEERLEDPMLKTIPAGSRVFVGSMTDLGAPWAAEYIPRIIEVVKTRPDVTFIFLTKQAAGFTYIGWPDNCWVGVTVESFGDRKQIAAVAHVMAKTRFISFEPLRYWGEFPLYWHYWRPDWIIIGAMTGPGAKRYAPKQEWIADLVENANRERTPVFMKSNLRPYWDGEWRQEYPKGARP